MGILYVIAMEYRSLDDMHKEKFILEEGQIIFMILKEHRRILGCSRQRLLKELSVDFQFLITL